MVLKTGVIGIFNDFLIATEAVKVNDAREKKEFEDDMRDIMDDVASFKEFRRRYNEAFMFGCVRRKANFYYLPYAESEDIVVEGDYIYLKDDIMSYEEGIEPIIINYTNKQVKIRQGE